RDLVEDHPPDRYARLQDLDEMPGDCLAFPIFVGGEQELVGAVEAFLELGDDLLFPRIDDVVRLEAALDVDAERTEALALALGHVFRPAWKVTYVTDARPDRVPVSQVAGDGPRFGRRFHDDQALAHGATP